MAGALRTGSECIPRLLAAFAPSPTPLDVFCVLSVDPGDPGHRLSGAASAACQHLRYYNYTPDTLAPEVREQLAGFPYDRAQNAASFPNAYNMANQLRLWEAAWGLLEVEEAKHGAPYRSIARFRPDLFVSSALRIDRDAWADAGNWRRPRAVYAFSAQGAPARPGVLPRTGRDFIVLAATEQWVPPWTDQAAFGGREAMKCYLTALGAVDRLPHVSFFPEKLLGDVLLWRAQRSESRALTVFTPKDFVTCICRQMPCGGDCVVRRFTWGAHAQWWDNLKGAVRSRMCADESLNALVLGELVA